MKNRLLTCSLALLGFVAMGQSELKATKNWTLFYEDERIQFYSKYYDCEVPAEGLYAEYVLLKAVNKTNHPIEITWFTDAYYGNECANCDHDARDRKRTTKLSPKQIIEGDCLPGLNIGLKVFSKWLRMENKRTLTRVAVTDITTQYIK